MIQIFFSYSHRDEEYRNGLELHLATLKRQGIVKIWHDRRIDAGEDVQSVISEHLEKADVVLLLVSPFFLASYYCYDVELARALERHGQGKARLIPVIVRPCDWRHTSFGHLRATPADGKPILKYNVIDDAYLSIVEDIRRVAAEMSSAAQPLESSSVPATSATRDEARLAAAHLVPTPVTHLVGRQEEIHEVCCALRQGTSIVVTGLPGIGKSTLVAFAVRSLWADGANPYTDLCFHRVSERDSAEERAGRMLVDLVARLNPSSAFESEDLEARFAQARRVLAGRRVLLVIDEADHDFSQEAVYTVRNRLPALTLAVTSRHGVWRDLRVLPLKGMSPAEGAELFSLEFGSVKGHEDSVAELCRQVGGHPMMITHLAVEAKHSGQPPEQVTASNSSASIDRNLAVRFDAIYDRASKGQRRLFAVVGILDTATIRVDLLQCVTHIQQSEIEALADLWLVHLHREKRSLSVHDLVRVWCRERLDTIRDEIDDLRVQVAEFYQGLFTGERSAEDLAELDCEWPNVLGLIDRLSDCESILSLVDGVIGDHFDDPSGYAPSRRQTSALLSRSKRLLDCCDRVGGDAAAKVEKNLGHFFYWRGDHENAERLFHRARDRYRELADRSGEACTTWLLGYLADDENRYQEALSLYLQGTEIAESLTPENNELVAIGHHLVGCTLYHQGRFSEAEASFRRAQSLITPGEAPSLWSRIERRVGYVAIARGRLDDAEAILVRVARQVEALRRPRDAARISRKRALICLRRGDLQGAETLLRTALADFKDQGFRRGEGSTIRDLATLARIKGNLDEAERLCHQSIHVAESTGSLYGIAAGHEEMAEILHDLRHPSAEIHRHRRRASNTYLSIGHQRGQELAADLDRTGAMEPPLPQPTRGFIFDLMDTLAYLDPGVYRDAKLHMAKRLGVSFERFLSAWEASRKNASTGVFSTTEDRMRWVGKTLAVKLSEDECHDLAQREDEMWRTRVEVIEGSYLLLAQLRTAGMKLAVVSNGPVAMRSLRDHLGLGSLVDVILFSHAAGVLKPDPGIYNKALEDLGLAASCCVYVGDGNDRELDGARAVGLYTIRVRRERAPYASMKNQSIDWDRAVDRLDDIGAFFPAAGR
ncbi:MAG TPA: HAD-IA family hydrolase [Thermoanaerobaculia bacterium]|jgi:HAD superfamily hydrolase (TIGR01549 family)|nr:HAD-IA family hydrolase [Thermoanaerobaculia bacterium]